MLAYLAFFAARRGKSHTAADTTQLARLALTGNDDLQHASCRRATFCSGPRSCAMSKVLELDEHAHRLIKGCSGRVVGESSSREIDDDACAAEVDEGDERLGGVEAEAAVADEADAAVEALEAPV